MLASSFQLGPDGSPRSESDRRALVRFVDQSLGHGFRLAIVEAANHADREAILTDLASIVGDGLLRIAVGELPGADSNLWAALQEPFAAQEPRCLALWDFESLGLTDWAHRLNVQRDLFVRDFAVPWLLFIHPASRVQLLQDAPDFCDFAILWVRDERPPVAVGSLGMAMQGSLLPAGPSDADNPLLREAQEALEAARFDAARDALARFDLQSEQSVLDRVRREYLGARLEREQGHLAAAEALIRSAGNMLAQQPQSAEVQRLAGTVDTELGAILLRSGRLREAELLLRKTLQAVGQTQGLDHPNYGVALNKLAAVLVAQGRYFEAESVMKEALDIQRRNLGWEHGAHGLALEALADILIEQGRYAEAEGVIRDSLDVMSKTVGREHPDYGASLHGLGRVLSAQGRELDAEHAFHEVLAIKERALGREHPSYTGSVHGLAGVLSRQGRYAEAARMLEDSLPTLEKAVGQEHFEYGRALNNLAAAWIRQGRYAEAEKVVRRGLAILERTLGPEHPDCAVSLHMFTQALAGQGKLADAERALRRSLSIVEKVFGHEHPRLYSTLVELAEIVGSQGRVREQIRLLERALSIRQGTLGAEDPGVRQVQLLLKDLKRRRLRR